MGVGKGLCGDWERNLHWGLQECVNTFSFLSGSTFVGSQSFLHVSWPTGSPVSSLLKELAEWDGSDGKES